MFNENRKNNSIKIIFFFYNNKFATSETSGLFEEIESIKESILAL